MDHNTPILPRDIPYSSDMNRLQNFPVNTKEQKAKEFSSGFNLDDYISSRSLKKINWFLLMSIVVVVAYMFRVKGHVQDLNFEIGQISSQIEQEKKQFSMLKAELAYLRAPDRLQRLALEYLDLELIKPAQLKMPEVRSGKLSTMKFAVFSAKKSKVKWKYKNMNYDNIHTVSTK